MSQRKTVLLSIAYLPPIAWFQAAVNAELVVIENAENYLKQSYRNRCKILTANGIMVLSIPIQHSENKLIQSVQTSTEDNWRKQHWQAICSAYGKSAFFLYYRDALEPYFNQRGPENLFQFNLGLIQLLGKLLKINIEYSFSGEYMVEPSTHQDLRNYFQAKGIPRESELLFQKKYFQVFADKFPFQANLSVLDVLFNVGPLSKDYLLLA